MMSYTLPEFLAHAIAMEEETAERYLELADMMEAHRNDEVSSLFRDMHRFSLMHRDAIRERVGSIELPRLKSWQYRWRTPPEMGDDDAFDYMLDAYHALNYARENEARAMQYYQSVAEESSDAEVKRLAGEFAAEEAEHVAALEQWIGRTQRPSETWERDPQAMK
jgi:rubrerythrin